MANILRITFTDIPLENAVISWWIGTTSSSFEATETFNAIDTGANSVEIHPTSLGKQAELYRLGLVADYGTSSFTTELDETTTTVIITSVNDSDTFFDYSAKSLVSSSGDENPVEGDEGVYSVPFTETREEDQQVTAEDVMSRSPKFTFSDTFEDQERNRMTFIFSGNVTASESITFRAIRNGSIVRTFTKTFTDSSNSLTQIPVGSSIGETVTNMRDNFQEFDGTYYFEYIISNDGEELYLDVFDETPEPNWQITSNTSVIEGATASSTHSEDSTSFNVYVWEGPYSGSGVTASSVPIFTKSKQKVLDDQTKTYIDFTPLVRSSLEFDINQYLSNSTISKITSGTGRWCRVEKSNQIFGYDRTVAKTNYYYITDGWIGATEIQGMSKILTTGNSKIYNEDSMSKLFFKTQDLQSINTQPLPITGGSIPTNITSPIFGTYSNSDEYINSLRVFKNQNGDGDKIRYNFIYGAVTQTTYSIDVEWQSECKYDPIDIYFVNKYGVVETINFNKLHSRTLKRSSDKFKRSIVDVEGNYDRKRHTNKEFNVTGIDEWTLNTDFIPESMNHQFEELFMNEYVWMSAVITGGFSQRSESIERVVVPVLITDSTIKYKKKLTDKQIQYTIKVELSHEKVNNIR